MAAIELGQWNPTDIWYKMAINDVAIPFDGSIPNVGRGIVSQPLLEESANGQLARFDESAFVQLM